MIPAVILAGGASRRMGGGVKPLLKLSGKPMIEHVVDRLQVQAGPLAVNANSGDFEWLGLPVVADSIPDKPGPLAGVLAAMDWARGEGADWVVTVAGDTPFFPMDLVQVLQAQIGDAPIALAATQEEERLFSHPVFGLWSTSLADDLRAAVMDGTRKVLNFTDPHGAVLVEFDAASDPFFNVNTPEELALAEQRLGA